MKDENLVTKILRLSVEKYAAARPNEKKIIKELTDGIVKQKFQDSNWLSTILKTKESTEINK